MTEGRDNTSTRAVRVLILSPFASVTSGVWTFVRNLTAGLRGEPIDVGFEAIDTEAIPPGMKNVIMAKRSLGVVWRRRRWLEVVHCQQLHPQSLMAGLLARILGKRVLITVHGRPPRPKGFRGLVFDVLERACLVVPHRVVFVADSLRQALGPGELIPNGVPVAVIRRGLDHRDELRRELGLDEAFVLLFSGRVTKDKGFLVLADAVAPAQVEAQTPIRILAVGPVAQDVAADLSGRSGEPPLLLGTRDEPWSYCAAADAFVLPSYREGLPFSLLEAMAAGLPAIASRVGDIPRVVVPGDTGWLVNPGDAAALKSTILEVLLDRDEVRRRGRRSAQLIERDYSLEKMVSGYVRVYRDLAGRIT